MHNPRLNPSACPALNGKRRRYANGTVATRHVRLDRKADRDLAFLQHTLSGDNPSDVTSVSLVCRRALAVFRQRVATLSGESLEYERQKVRTGSRLPRIRKPLPVPAHSTTH